MLFGTDNGFDRQRKQVVAFFNGRLEAWPKTRDDSQGASQESPEVVLTYEQVRLPDGTWIHALTWINTTRHAPLFNQVRIDFQEVFSDYR